MKKYGRCPKFERGDNSTCTFTKRRRACTLKVQLLLNSLLDFYETLHSCNTLLQMCMKEYGCCPKFGRGDNLTYTLKYVLYGEMGL